MYKIKKSEHIVEDVRIEGEKKALELHVDLSPDMIARQYSVLTSRIAKLQEKEETPYEEMGAAVLDLMRLVFGDAGAEALVEFYGGDYMDMLTDTMDFITVVVAPAMRKVYDERKARYESVLKR